MPYIFNPFTGNFDNTVPLSGGKVPAEYLPSYVDDVVEYASLAAFPATGETGKIYLALDASTIYRWSGSQYVLIGSNVSAINDLSDIDTSTTAPTDGQALVWDNTAQVWKPKTVPATIAAQNDYSLRLSPNITGGRWNVKTTQDPTPGQFWQISSTQLMVDKFDSLGVDIITSLFPAPNPSRVIWLSSDGVTWTQRTAEIVPDNNFTRINIRLGTAYTSGSALFIETVDPSNGPATLPLDNKNVLTYNSGTQKWEPTPIGVSSLVDVDTATVAPTDGQALVWDQASEKWQPGAFVISASLETESVADLGSSSIHDFTLAAGSVFNLLEITTSPYSWIRIYDSSAARSADTRTSPGAPFPAAGTGFYAEIATASLQETIKFAPVPTCQGTNGLAYVRLVNIGASTASYSSTFSFVTIAA